MISMKNDEIKGVVAVDKEINTEAGRMSKAYTAVLNLFMQVLSNCVATRDIETLSAIEQEVNDLFKQAHELLKEQPAAVKAGLN